MEKQSPRRRSPDAGSQPLPAAGVDESADMENPAIKAALLRYLKRRKQRLPLRPLSVPWRTGRERKGSRPSVCLGQNVEYSWFQSSISTPVSIAFFSLPALRAAIQASILLRWRRCPVSSSSVSTADLRAGISPRALSNRIRLASRKLAEMLDRHSGRQTHCGSFVVVVGSSNHFAML